MDVFFDTGEAHAVMLAAVADEGRPPGSSPPEAGKGKEQAESICLAHPVA